MMINLFHKRPVKADMGLILFMILVISIMIMMVLMMILVISIMIMMVLMMILVISIMIMTVLMMILVISIMIMMVLVMILVILTILTWQERLLLLPPPCSTSRSKALLKAPFLPEISDWHLYLHSSFYIFCLKKNNF